MSEYKYLTENNEKSTRAEDKGQMEIAYQLKRIADSLDQEPKEQTKKSLVSHHGF